MYQNILRVGKCVRPYSSRPLIGLKFQSFNEIKEYIFKDNCCTNEYLSQLEQAKDRGLPVASRETVLKLLKLSGLPSKGADVEGIQETLNKQISFINILHDTDLDDSLDVKETRLLRRKSPPLSYQDLIAKINDGQNSDSSGSWDSTSRATMSKNGYFIIREEFLTGRD